MLITNETGFKFYGLNADQMTLVVTYAESLRDGTNVMPLNDHSRKLNNELEGIILIFTLILFRNQSCIECIES